VSSEGLRASNSSDNVAIWSNTLGKASELFARNQRISLVVSLLVLGVYLPAAGTIATGWDEGYTWKRIDALEPWVRRWFQPGTSVGDQLSAATLSRYWQFSREEPDGHGPFYALLSNAGHELTHRLFGPPMSYRVGSVALFALACGALFRCLSSRWGTGPAGVAVGLVAMQPRIVPEVCFGVVDGPLLSLAILTYCGFLGAIERPTFWRIMGFGVAAGCAMATKLTGWVLLGPYVAFAVVFVNQRTLKVLGWGVLIAAATCLLLNVGWWPNPLDGLVRFFRSNLTRAETTHIPIYFLGRNFDFALPWYNTLVWTLVAVPPLTVVLGLIGLVGAGRRTLREWASGQSDCDGESRPTTATSAFVLAALVWAAIMVVRALPQAPGHDGVRQIIIAFAYLAILAGGGVYLLQGWRRQRGAMMLGWIAVGASAFECLAYHPFELSYYSPVVGGLPGAVKNFEPTYFWDSLTPEAIEWLNKNTPTGRSVLFVNNPENWRYLHRWGTLKALPYSPEVHGTAPPIWFVLQHRTALLSAADRRLLAEETPAFRVAKFGVPLLSIYSIQQYDRITEGRPQKVTRVGQ